LFYRYFLVRRQTAGDGSAQGECNISSVRYTKGETKKEEKFFFFFFSSGLLMVYEPIF
jgi:hypothetical protein